MLKKLKKKRLDELLLEKNLVKQDLIIPMIMAGEIWVNNQRTTSHAQKIDPQAIIEIKSLHKNKYVSRGGLKLEAALHAFNIEVKGKVCADFGASTGGFTDVLIQSGAKQVFAIETGENVLDPKLKSNPKVISLEGKSLFKISEDHELNLISSAKEKLFFTTQIDLAVVDLSFIPLKHALPHISKLTKNAKIIALLKPHYEAQDTSLLTNGVIQDEKIRERVVQDFLTWLKDNNYKVSSYIESPVKGRGRNIEYLIEIDKS